MKARAFGAQSFHDFNHYGQRETDEIATYLGHPRVGDKAVVERWQDGRWVEVDLVWDGESYVQA